MCLHCCLIHLSFALLHVHFRIALEDPLQVTLRHNYYGLKHLLEVVRPLPGLAGIVHVSTAFVNCCRPFLPDGTAEERIYPLQFGDREVRHCLQLCVFFREIKGQGCSQDQCSNLILCALEFELMQY